jgi:hypothetical protein
VQRGEELAALEELLERVIRAANLAEIEAALDT